MSKVTVLVFSLLVSSNFSFAQDGGGVGSGGGSGGAGGGGGGGSTSGQTSNTENERLAGESMRDFDKFINDENFKNVKKSRPKFAKLFGQAQKAILKDDVKAAADSVAKLHEIQNLNLYEEARLHLVDYWYYGKLGNQELEFDAASKLMAMGAGNIDPPAYVEAGMRLLKRQYNRQDIGGAIETLTNLRKEPESSSELMSVVQVVKKLDDVAEQKTDFVQKITVDESGAWSAKLFKPRFFFNAVNGEINALGFDCTNKQTTLTYKPDSVMEIPEDWGSCRMKVGAEPKTSFNLVQQKPM